MFTLDQIYQTHSRVKSGADFPQYVQDLKAIGVIKYDTYVSDGRARFYGTGDFILDDKPKYPALEVNPVSSSEQLKHAIKIHQQGQTDYPTFCQQAAAAGVEKWTTDMYKMTVTYLDKDGHTLTVEPVPNP